MYDAIFWSNVIDSLVWPATLFGISLLFRVQILSLINRLKQLKGYGLDLYFGDKVPVFSPDDNAFHSLVLKPVTEEKLSVEKTELKKLPPEEQEASKKKAQTRLDDDIKRNGSRRGELFQNPDGSWSISWNVESLVKIGVKAG